MTKRAISILSLGLIAAAVIRPVNGQGLPPAIFYSDLDSGPNVGGPNNVGAFVTVYGKGFGATQGSSLVTIGGGAAASYALWTDTKVSFQLGPAAKTGGITVTTPQGVSNPVPFTVRPGNIYFVATNGNDSSNGSFSAPWATLPHARNAMVPGDITYARNGVAQSTYDVSAGWGGCFTFAGNNGGSAGMPVAFVVYPGESATIGASDNSCLGPGINEKGQGEGYITIAGFTIRGHDVAVDDGYTHNWRVVANDISCPNGNDQAGCYTLGVITTARVYGNNIHDVATNLNPASVTALYHGVYIVDGSSDVDFGWNTVQNVNGCRGIQENSSTSQDASNLQIHDNVIHDTQCDGIVLVTVDPTQAGGINVYNNLIYNVGKGPANADNSGGWRCIAVGGYDVQGTTTGTIEVYNNTMYGCGTYANPPYQGSSGGVSMNGPYPGKRVHLRNNIIELTTGPAGLAYLLMDDGNGNSCPDTPPYCSRIYGSNNLFYGNGLAPANTNLTGSLSSNPLFVNATAGNFQLAAGSPAATAGIPIAGLLADALGVRLPQGGGFPIGALALVTGSTGGSTPVVSITPTATTLDGGQTQQFSSTVTGTTQTSVTWSMSPAVGSISASGLYTAPSPVTSQTILVSATSTANSSVVASATVNLVPVAVSISAPVTLAVGQTNQFTATVTGANNTAVTWSMNPQVGTLSSTGFYTAPASVSNQTTISVTATSVTDPTKSASATVTVNPSVSVVASPATVQLSANQTQQFTATVSGSSNSSVNWSLSPSMGAISSTGMFTAPSTISSQMMVNVTATSAADSTKSATVSVTLMPPATPVSVTVTPGTSSLSGSQTQQFTATVSGSSNTAVTWSLSPSIGGISSTGMFTAPSSISSQTTVRVTATSAVDSTKSSSATVTLMPPATPVSVTVTPGTSSLSGSQAQQFTATVSGSSNTAVTWSLSPSIGGISSTGMFTAPSSISSQTTVRVTATSAADSTKSSSAMVTLMPPATPVSVTVTPGTSSLSGSQAQQFTATVSGSSNTSVTWSLSPSIGGISSTGMFTAPATISAQTTVMVTATSAADPTKSSSATITLLPATPLVTTGGSQSLAFSTKISGTSLIITWTAPGTPQPADRINLTSVDAPDWWTVWSKNTRGAASGTITVALPTTPGIYELRYYLQDSYTLLAKSAPIPVKNGGFTISPAATSVGAGSSITVPWTAGGGRNAADYIGLYPTGGASDQPVAYFDTNGKASGTFTFTAPSTPGTYEFRYILGARNSYTYICIAKSATITVH